MDLNETKVKEKKIDKGFFKKAWKPFTATVLALCLLGGGAAFLWHRHEEGQKEKARAAQSEMIKADAATNNVKLISEKEIQQIVSKKIGVPTDSIKFDSIYLGDKGQGGPGHYGDKKDKKEHGFPQAEQDTNSSATQAQQSVTSQGDQVTNAQAEQTTETAPTYIYRVKCTANSLEYKLSIDAVTGTVLSAEIDD